MSQLPSAEALQQLVDETFQQFHGLPGGENASYIPYLASVPDELAALVIVTANGDVYQPVISSTALLLSRSPKSRHWRY